MYFSETNGIIEGEDTGYAGVSKYIDLPISINLSNWFFRCVIGNEEWDPNNLRLAGMGAKDENNNISKIRVRFDKNASTNYGHLICFTL